MSEIDQAWLAQAFESGAAEMASLSVYSDHATRDAFNLLLVAVADNLNARALAAEEAKRRGWKSAAAELTTAAHHVGAYADAMRHFDPDAAVVVVGEDAAPRCASFRKADADDTALCTLERGHDGDHADTVKALDSWPRKHSGEVCGDVLTVAGSAAYWNCQLPLGHDGDSHWHAHDGAGIVWPRGVNPRPMTGPVPRPNVNYPGKPDPDDVPGGDQGVPTPEQEAALYPGACGDPQRDDDGHRGVDADACMLPAEHTGIHIGRTGARWARALSAEELETARRLEIAESIGQPLDTIPVQRTEVTADIPGVGTVTASMGGETSLAIIGGMLANGETFAEVTSTMNSGTAVATLEHPVGAQVEVGGMTFTKRSDNPFPEHQPGGLSIVTGVSFDLPAAAAEAAGIGHAFAAGLGILTSGPRSNPVGLIPPGAPRARQSVSSITTMEDCGLKYRFTYRDQLPQIPAWWNVGGTAFHETVRVIEGSLSGDFGPAAELLEQQQTAGRLFAARLDAEIAKVEAESGVASQSWRAADKGKEDGARWRAAGDDMARLYVSKRQAWLAEWRLVRTLTGDTAQEIEFNHRFGSVELKGFIDDLWVHRTDPARVAVRDLKAGKRPPESDFQLDVYGEVIKALPTELAFTAEPLRVEGVYYLARKGETTAPAQLGDNAEIIAYRAEQVQRADEAGIFMPRPSSFCGSCPFRSKCPAVK